ncbi:MAG: DNA primase [Acholeplasmataceae bacterium]|jgi:DNA primase|nr:DNA primase [Acholeplasmataceae bacterium]
MDQKLIDEINEKTAIVDLVSEFVSLSKRGKNFMGLCPFHQEKTPSFSVSPEKNIAKCMSCGEGGSPINFLRKIKNISFEEAASTLAERAGITIKTVKRQVDPNESDYKLMKEVANFYQFNLNHSEKGQEALNYLMTRQMTDDSIKHFMLGLAPSYGQTLFNVLKDKGYAVSDMIRLGVVKQADDGAYYDLFTDRIIFPITNPKGEVVGLSGRTINAKEQVKYINSPETTIFKKGQLLYHFYEALPEIRKSKQVILYEGFFDVISSYQAGIKHGVATMGTSLTKDQAKLISQVTQSIIIAYDGDSAGIKAADQAIPILEKDRLKVEVLTIPEKMDPDDFIKAYGPEMFEQLFGEYTKDAYQFRYDAYKFGKNFQNANDVKEFKKLVLQMIKTSDQSVRVLYTQKLANDLGMNASDFEIIKSKPKEKEIVLPKLEKVKIRSKHENAERYLIFSMLRSNEQALKIQSMLKQTDFADHIAATIRLKIEHYYEENDKLDIAEFLDTLSSDQRLYMETDLLTDFHWKNKMDFSEDEIKSYVLLVKEANLKRRYQYLLEKFHENEEENKHHESEMHDILRQLKHY